LKRCSKKELCKQCRYMYVNFMGTMTKRPVQILNWWKGKPSGSIACTKTDTQNDTDTHRSPWRNRDLETTIFLCFSDFSFYIFFVIYNFLNEFSKKCWVTALVRSMTFVGILNQFSAIAPHTFLTLTSNILLPQNALICTFV